VPVRRLHGNRSYARFFELSLPDAWGFAVIASVVTAWGVVLRAIRRLRLPARLKQTFARIRKAGRVRL
jgi:hypothetical protein